MSLVVESGAGLADAESYISAAEHQAYCNARGLGYGSEAEIEQQARRAADYLGQVYRLRFKGYRTTSVQALDWPRAAVEKPDLPGGFGIYPGYYGQDEIPVELKRAQSELMVRAAAGDLAPDVERLQKRVRVEGAVEVEYEPGAPAVTRFRAVDNLLAPLLLTAAGSDSVRLVRL